MGRIADALRRAEEERRRSGQSGEGAIQVVDAPGGMPTELGEGEPRDPNAPLALVDTVAESLVPFYERSSLVTEQYRSLRTRLLSQNPKYEHRTLAITSAIPKEGKSVTTLNLGCILAEIRHLKVAVVDGDFRRSSLARMLNQSDGPGLADVLAGRAQYEDIIRETPIPNLSLIPAGSTGSKSAAELLTASSARHLFKRMRNEFHYTIVDTPPATTVTDVGIIGQMCDGVVLVVRLRRTEEGAARRAVRLLQVNNINIVGCLVVGRDSPSMRYGYNGYGYGYGYSYYNYYRYYDYYRKGDEGDPKGRSKRKARAGTRPRAAKQK